MPDALQASLETSCHLSCIGSKAHWPELSLSPTGLGTEHGQGDMRSSVSTQV